MNTQEVTMSKGDQLRAFFTENPNAGTVATAKQFECDPGYVSTVKKGMGIARAYHGTRPKKPVKKLTKKAKSVTHTNGTFKNGAGWGGESQILSGIGWKEYVDPQLSREVAPTPEVETMVTSRRTVWAAPASPWADYGLWMDREQLRGYLLGRAVEYLTKGDKLSVEEALRCVTKLSELTE
jgi:hypothetical protein